MNYLQSTPKLPEHCMNIETKQQTSYVTNSVADSGATRHFLIPSSGYKNIQALAKPIPVTIPNGNMISATHSCEVDYPQLPLSAHQGLIVPEMRHHSLISIRQLCEAGCHVTFAKGTCKVYYKGKLVMSGLEHPQTKLWMLPLSTNDNDIYVNDKYKPVEPPITTMWANLISPPPALTSKAELVR